MQRDPNVSDKAVIRAKDREEQDARKAINALEQSIIDHRKNEAQGEELRKSQKEAEVKDANERVAILREREKARSPLKGQSARRACERAAAELQAMGEERRQ